MFSTKALSVYITIFLFLLFLLLVPLQLKAQILPQNEQETEEPALPEWPEDPLDRRNPRGTISGFISAVADDNYIKASKYLNLSGLPDEFTEGPELAAMLENLLDQKGQILPYSRISSSSGGRIDDDLPPNLDEIGTLTGTEENIGLFVEEVKGPEGGPLWLISSETVEAIAALNTVEENTLLVEQFLPDFLEKYRWGGVSVGQWIIMLLLGAIAFFVAWTIISFILFLIPRVWKKAKTEPTAGVLKAFGLPAKLFLAVWLFVGLSQEIGISIIVRQSFSGITLIIGMLALLILLWRLVEFISNFSKERMTVRGHISAVSVVLFLKRAAKVAIIIFGVIGILGAFGVDVTTGLAALGIGGLALALGAQKTIENFVGSVTLITDQPIRVGDFCKVGDTLGTVEKIGMRSTQIRTLDRTIVTIPNGEFSSSKIENYAHRDRFWFHPVISLRYETTPDQIRYLLVELRAMLYAHPMVSPDPARVRFIALGADSLNLEVFAYVEVPNFDEFLEVREDLLLRIMDIVAESGTGFAFPSQTLYFAKDQGLSKDKSEDTEKKVKEWREKRKMQIPKFDPEEIEKIKNSIPYPPEGSSKSKDEDTGKIPGL